MQLGKKKNPAINMQNKDIGFTENEKLGADQKKKC